MLGDEHLKQREERKAVLLEQSATHRRELIAAAPGLRAAAAWVDLGISVAHATRSGWSALFPLISLCQSRKQEPAGLTGKLAGAISLTRSLTSLWKSWHQRPPTDLDG